MTPERLNELRYAAPPGSLAAGWLAECLNHIKTQAAVITGNAMLLAKQEETDVARADLIAELTLDRDRAIRCYEDECKCCLVTQAERAAATKRIAELEAELARVRALASALNRNNRSW